MGFRTRQSVVGLSIPIRPREKAQPSPPSCGFRAILTSKFWLVVFTGHGGCVACLDFTALIHGSGPHLKRAPLLRNPTSKLFELNLFCPFFIGTNFRVFLSHFLGFAAESLSPVSAPFCFSNFSLLPLYLFHCYVGLIMLILILVEHGGKSRACTFMSLL